MEFSNLGGHNVLGPCDWHWAALTVKFCASKSLLVLRISWCSYSLPGILVLYFHVGHRLTSLLLSCHQPFQLGGHVFGKRPHDLSGSTQCLRYPLPCLPPTASPHPLYSPARLSWACVYLPGSPALNDLSPSPFKILPPPPPPPPHIMMGLSHTQSSHPTKYFLSTLQKTPNKNAILQEVYFFFF